MLRKLEEIAADLGAMKSVAEGSDRTARFMLDQLIEHMDWTLREMAERPGVIPAPAPWLVSWQERQD